jgi:hypothetical protein
VFINQRYDTSHQRSVDDLSLFLDPRGRKITSRRNFAARVQAYQDFLSDSVKRVSAGVGEGSIAIAYVHQYLAAQST